MTRELLNISMPGPQEPLVDENRNVTALWYEVLHGTYVSLFDKGQDVTFDIPTFPVDLGAETQGNYVEDITSGTGVSVVGGVGAGSNPIISIGQDVSTTANVTFASVAVTGTVDGRDIAADGTKLDGIQTGATNTDTLAWLGL